VTPEQIESILSEFRDWLRVSAPPPDAPLPPEPVDLHTLVAQFTALRQEVNLQTRAVRQQQEQNAETLRQLEAAVQRPAASPSSDQQVRPLLNALVEVADAQQRAAEEVSNAAGLIFLREQEKLVLTRQSPTLRERLFGGTFRDIRVLHCNELRWLRERAQGTAEGLRMGLQRIERVMKQHGLEPIATAERPFDPEMMEAVEVVISNEFPAGQVYRELRRGYLLHGRVYRFAQVSVFKAPPTSQESS
jgi:molecular chaperone GrpE